MKYLFLAFLSAALFALEEGTFVQYQEAEEKTLTLQKRVVDYFGTFVTSSPYPGVRATLDGNDLMSNLSL